MTPADILAELRDIHTPADVVMPSAGLALWPFVLLALFFALWAWLIRRRRSLWQRQAKSLLRDIDQLENDDQAEARLIALRAELRRCSAAQDLPDQVFANEDAGQRRGHLRADIERRLAG